MVNGKTGFGGDEFGGQSPDILRSSPFGWWMGRIEGDGYACSFLFEDQFGVGDRAGASGRVSWVDDAVSDAGST
jgi:hypothetical protein